MIPKFGCNDWITIKNCKESCNLCHGWFLYTYYCLYPISYLNSFQQLVLSASYKMKLWFAAYTKTSGRYCGPHYGEYSSLELAQAACNSNSNCQGVVDFKCDESGTFSLCTKKAAFYSSSNDCTYDKGKVIFKYKYVLPSWISIICVKHRQIS